MSETKKNKSSMAHLVIVLFVITAIVALLLGLVNFITADRIQENKNAKTTAAMKAVITADSYDPIDNYTDDSGFVTKMYEAKDSDGTVGYVVEVTPNGFGGAIDMVVGIDTEDKVTGISIVSMSETSGLGANAQKSAFRDQFTGKTGTLAVSKDGGEIAALTGATITSRAVTRGVNAAIAVVAAIG